MGLLPSNYKLASLGESEKRHIRRVEQKVRENSPSLLRTPEKFLGGRISAKRARAIENLGFPVYRTKKGFRFFAESQHADTISFNTRTGQITRRFKHRKTTSYPFDEAPATIKRVEQFFKKRKKGQFLTFRVGARGYQFNTAIYNMKDFERYLNQLEEMESEDDEGEEQRFPIEHLQIVEVNPHEPKSPPHKTRPRKNSRPRKN